LRMAGGEVKPGRTIGETDEPGLDHTKLTYKFQGRNFRLAVSAAKILRDA
jgi:hypothetical protein